MEPLESLESFHRISNQFDCTYALCGGLTASLYREKVRTTSDVDIAIVGPDPLKIAKEILAKLKLKTSLGMIYSGERKIDITALVIGQYDEDDYENTIDIFLPVLPWVEKAVARAQSHKIDFGFAEIPTIPVEDLLLAKAFALEFEPNRYQDLDDISSIFKNKKNEFQLDYLVGEFKNYSLSLPIELDSQLPARLAQICKENRG